MRPRLLVTHNGTFHLDDVMAYAILRLVFPDMPRLVRTRDAATIASADIVWDVGQIYDPATMRFDHHQADAPSRENGPPFSAAGLIWKHYGREAVAACLGAKPCATVVKVVHLLDQQLFERIDQIDNGVTAPPEALNLASIIADMNLRWDQPHSQQAEDDAFLRAADLASSVLRQRIYAETAAQAAMGVVHHAHVTGADKRILELPEHLPWQDAAFAYAIPALYAVYPSRNGQWMVDTMPQHRGAYEQRLPLPSAWAGLSQAELAAATNVHDAIFVHPKRFIGAAGSREGALAMARQAIEIGLAEAARQPRSGNAFDIHRPFNKTWT